MHAKPLTNIDSVVNCRQFEVHKTAGARLEVVSAPDYSCPHKGCTSQGFVRILSMQEDSKARVHDVNRASPHTPVQAGCNKCALSGKSRRVTGQENASVGLVNPTNGSDARGRTTTRARATGATRRGRRTLASMREQPRTTGGRDADSAPSGGPQRVAVHASDEEEQDAREYVSQLWSQDWDSPEDAAYDNCTNEP